MAKELFYSINEDILFYIAGYTDNSDNVTIIQKTLVDGVNELERLAKTKIDKKKVMTTYVTISDRYKYMRVFYIGGFNVKKVPKEAFLLGDGNDWTMRKWLKGNGR